MGIRIYTTDLERTKAQLDSLLQSVGKANQQSPETRKQMNAIGTEWRGMLRQQNLVINSWRIMHPQLSLLTRGLSNVATVGHVLVNAFQALNIMQLRQKEGARDLADLLQKRLDLVVQITKAEKEFGALDPRVVELKGKFAEVNNEIGKLEDNLKSAKWQDMGNKIAIALSLVGVGANIANAIAAFKALGVAMVGTGGAGGLVAISKLVSGAFTSMWAKVLAPVAVVLALDYVIAKMRNIPSVLEIAAAQFPAADFTDMLPTVESSKKAQELINKRIQGEAGASLVGIANLPTTPQNPSVPQAPALPINPPKQDFWDWLKNSIIAGLSSKSTAGLAFGETGGGIPQHEPSQLPFGKGGAIGEFPARPPTFGEKATQLATEATNTESQRNRELANTQENLDRIEQQIYAENKAIIPNTGTPSARLLALVDEQSKLESARTELNNIIGRREDARRFKDLTGIDLDTYNRVAKIAYDEGVSIADVSPAIGTRLGLTSSLGRGAGGDAATIQALLSIGANVPTRLNDKGFREYYLPEGSEFISGGMQGGGFGVRGASGIDAYEKLFGKDIAVLGGFDLATPSGGWGGYVSAEAYRQQQAIANGGSIYAINKGIDYYGNTKYDPSTLNINPDVASRTAREKFVAGMYGFASGGIINEPIIGTGLNTGRGYSFGESGPETITPGRGGSMVVNVYVSGSLVAEADLIRKVSEGVARGIQRQVR